jgi:hypothetical protein
MIAKLKVDFTKKQGKTAQGNTLETLVPLSNGFINDFTYKGIFFL